MARSVEEYKRLFLSLLPKGSLWTRNPNSLIVKFFKGLAKEFNRLDLSINDLFTENFVTTTTELLIEHETDFDLPEEGFSLADTTQGRRDELLAALVKRGEQDKAYFEEIAENLGYDITITEFTPFWCGVGQCGDPCGDQNNLFYWRINILISSVTEPYEVNISKLIAKFQKLKPGHTHVLFEFYGPEFSRGFGRAFDRIPSYDNSWGLLEEKELDFSRDFSNAFANAYDYDGIFFTGSYNHAFSIAFDRRSGSVFSNSFSIDFDTMGNPDKNLDRAWGEAFDPLAFGL